MTDWDWADVAAVGEFAKHENAPVALAVDAIDRYYGTNYWIDAMASAIRYGYAEAQRDRERALSATWTFVALPNPAGTESPERGICGVLAPDRCETIACAGCPAFGDCAREKRGGGK